MDFKVDISNVIGSSCPKKALLLLHGYGSNGRDMLGLAEQLVPFFPEVVFIAPDAPEVINPGAYIWYELPISEEDISSLADENLCRKFKDICIKKYLYISMLVDEIKSKYSLKNADIGLWGFSQGGLLALVSGLTIQPTLSCVIASSSIPLVECGNWLHAKPPCFLTHGQMDDVVPPVAMDITTRVLRNKGVSVQNCLSPTLFHGIDGLCQQEAIRFLKSLWKQ